MSLRVRLSSYWCAFQEYLFPTIEADLGPLGERYQPVHHRARVGAGGTTSALFSHPALARKGSCGVGARLHRQGGVPDFLGWPTTGRCAACAAGSMRAPCQNTGAVGRSLSRDATAIEGREKPTAKPKQPAKPKRKRGRPRKGEERPKEPSRLQRQQQMTLVEMLDDLPHACDVGTKRNAKGSSRSALRQPDCLTRIVGSATNCISTRATAGLLASDCQSHHDAGTCIYDRDQSAQRVARTSIRATVPSGTCSRRRKRGAPSARSVRYRRSRWYRRTSGTRARAQQGAVPPRHPKLLRFVN